MREKYRGIKGRFLARLGHGPWAMANGKRPVAQWEPKYKALMLILDSIRL